LFCSAFSLFTTEYFFGIELLRPMLLWIVVGEKEIAMRKRAIRTAIQWLPYLLVWAGYAAYHLWLLQSSTYKGYEIQVFDTASVGPTVTIIHAIQAVVESIAKGGFAAWTQTATLFTLPLDVSSTLLYLLVGIFSLAAALPGDGPGISRYSSWTPAIVGCRAPGRDDFSMGPVYGINDVGVCPVRSRSDRISDKNRET
jgi:hypothetical protein